MEEERGVPVPELGERTKASSSAGDITAAGATPSCGPDRRAAQSLERLSPLRALHVVRDDACVVAPELAVVEQLVLPTVRREQREGRGSVQRRLRLAQKSAELAERLVILGASGATALGCSGLQRVERIEILLD